MNSIQIKLPKAHFESHKRNLFAQPFARLVRMDNNTKFRLPYSCNAKQAEAYDLPVKFSDIDPCMRVPAKFVKPTMFSQGVIHLLKSITV
jgi:hypothetical protein